MLFRGVRRPLSTTSSSVATSCVSSAMGDAQRSGRQLVSLSSSGRCSGALYSSPILLQQQQRNQQQQQQQPPRSRFSVRAPSGLTETQASITGAVDLIKEPRMIKQARALAIQCDKVVADYLTSPSPTVKATILAAITQIDIEEDIPDCDILCVLSYLKALAALDAPGTSRAVDSCGKFVVKNYQFIKDPTVLATFVHCFVRLNYSRANDLLHILSTQVQRFLARNPNSSLDPMDSKCAALVFASYCSVGPRGASTAQVALNLLRNQMGKTSIADCITVLEALSVSEKKFSKLSAMESQGLVVELAFKLQESASMLTGSQAAQVLVAIAAFKDDRLHGLGKQLLQNFSAYSLDVQSIVSLLDAWGEKRDGGSSSAASLDSDESGGAAAISSSRADLGDLVYEMLVPRIDEILQEDQQHHLNDLAEMLLSVKGKHEGLTQLFEKKLNQEAVALLEKSDKREAVMILSLNEAKILKAACRYLLHPTGAKKAKDQTTTLPSTEDKIRGLVELVLDDPQPPPSCIAALLQTPTLVIDYFSRLKKTFLQAAGAPHQNQPSQWSLVDFIAILESLASGEGGALVAQTPQARDLSRVIGPGVAHAIKNGGTSSTMLVQILSYYGTMRVRHEMVCSAAVERSLQLKKEFSGSEITSILGSFMKMDFRSSTRVFTEFAVYLRSQIHTLTGSEAAILAAAFSKMLLWNYRLFCLIAEQAISKRADMSLDDISLLLTAFYKVQWKQDTTFHEFLGTIKSRLVARKTAKEKKSKGAGDGSDEISQAAQIMGHSFSRVEALKILTAFSRLHLFDETVYDLLIEVALEDDVVVESHDYHRLVQQQQKQLVGVNADDIGCILMGYARVDMKHERWFKELHPLILKTVPRAGPLALADIATAFSVCDVKNEEVFSLIAERVLETKADCPAITIASVLVAFAKVGVRNDKLFVDLIPRVRYVAHHGSATDVVNVLSAYSLTGLWHYKLFTRLGDRAVLLRSDFTAPMVTALLAAYAKIEMKYEKIFVEFSPKIQSVLNWFIAAELVSILESYAAVKITDSELFKAIVDKLCNMHSELDQAVKNDFAAVVHRLELPMKPLVDVGIESTVPLPTTTISTEELPIADTLMAEEEVL